MVNALTDRMVRFIIAVVVVLNALSCHAIDLEEAIEKAVENSSKIRSKFYEYKSNEKHLKSSGMAGFLPEVNLQYQFNEHFDLRERHIITLKHSIIDGGGSFAKFGKSQYLLKGEKAKLHRLKQQVILDAVKAYVNVLRKTEMLKLREHKERTSLEHLSAMQKRFSLSEVTNTEVSLAKAKFSSSVSERVNAEGNLKLAKVAYRHLVGEEADDLSEVDELFLPAIPELSECLQLARTNNLSLKEITYQKKAAKKEVTFQQSEFLPSLNLIADNKSSSGSVADNKFNFNLTFVLDIPILKKGINSFGMSKAKMDVKKLTYAYHEAIKDVEQEVVNAWNNILTAKAMIKASQEAEKAAALALEGVEKEVSLNLKSTADLLETEDALFNSRSSLVEARSNYVTSVYKLLFIINNMSI